MSTPLHRRPRTSRTAVLAACAGLSLALSACGGGTDTSAGPAASRSQAPGAAAVSAEHNEADLAFVRDMSPHHEGALAMAELASTRAADPAVKALATRIAGAQGPEMERMSDMARAWDAELGGAHSGHSMSGGSSMSMDRERDTAALEPLSGTAFDREFLTRMIAHHEGALPMARAVVEAGENPQAERLAQDVLTSQAAEIAEMKQLLTQL